MISDAYSYITIAMSLRLWLDIASQTSETPSITV